MANLDILNGQFLLQHTTSTSGDYTAVLSTENKFVDKNIGIKITTPAVGTLTLNATDITTSLSMGTAISNVYSPTVTITGNVNIESAGWITAGNKSVSDANVAIGKVNQSLLKQGNTEIASGSEIIAGTIDQTITITEGYNEGRTLIVKASSSGTSAEATVSGTTAATTPTIAKTTTTATGATNVGGSNSASTTAPSSGYFVSLRATAPATTVSLTKTIDIAGYLNSPDQIDATASTSATTGDIYYLPITTGVATTDAADVNIYSTDGSNAGVNISSIVGTKVTSEPTSGYYLAFKGEGNSKVTTAGWFQTGSLAKTTSAAKYFPITAATGSVTGTNTVSPTASLNGSNVTLDNTNNGISVTATGGGTASVTASANITTAGYAPEGNGFASAVLTASSNTTTATKYISAITIPSSKSLTITNNGTATMTSSGTTNLSNTGTATITSTSKTAGNVTIAAYDTSNSSSTTSKSVVTSGIWTSTTVSASGTYYGKVIVGAGTITNNTTLASGKTSSGTINRGNYIKIGAGYYNTDTYYLAQANSGTYTVSSSGVSSVDGYANINVTSTSVTEGTTTVSGTTATRGTASWETGWITNGSITAATFANSATNGQTYVDISDTTSAPVLSAGGYLYINKGYTDNLRISLAKLVPNGASANLTSSVILSGYSAYNNDGVLVAGNIETYDGSYTTT